MDLYVGAGDLGVNPADGPVVGQQVLQVKVVDPAGEAGDAEPTGRLRALVPGPGGAAGHCLHDVLQEVRAEG